ncbi:MAG: hypothetical protein ACPLRJ_03910 [Infirmifilum uzonense]|jgi:chromosome segregation ATPase|uniref:hypothetical protein n=1 Tax=Infirmifilum TaxID=2856573 RepID=UPI003C763206
MSTGGVCPGLYRDTRGRFYCKYAGGVEVDPAFMPCLMEYWECPYYIEWRKKSTEEKKPVEQIVPAPQPQTQIKIEKPETLSPEVKEERTGLEKITEEIDTLITRASELSRIWEEYERDAREVIEKWENLRDYLEKELLSIKSSINTLTEELERIETKHKLGILDDTHYQELRSEIDSKISQKNSEMDNIKRKLDELDRLVIPHYKRVKVAEVKPEIAKIRLALNKLEQKFKEGEVAEETYRRLRAELEAKLKRLERIREEVEE